MTHAGGRPRKPVEQKRLIGNPGKRRLPALTTVTVLPQADATPEPPRPLGAAGKDLWEAAWSAGISWISPSSDRTLLLLTCEQADRRTRLRVKALQGDSIEDHRILNEVEKLFVANLSLLGFSPTDRTRLGVAEVKKQNALEDLIARRSTGTK